MIDTPETQNTSSQLRRALVAIKDLRARLDAAEQAQNEPVAIIGMGCRFPGGASNPQAFWDLLRNGVDAISETPKDRWDNAQLYDPNPAEPGKLATRWGGFLEHINLFDPNFFGISPREAGRMDPQQRILMEVAYETLEDSGQSIDALAGSQTGVFVGVHSHSTDYCWLQYAHPDEIDTYTGTGTSHSVLAGRVSYWLDLKGPSISIDTACSSSMIAIHLACQSLMAGECSQALAGGVNVILSPEFTISASRMHMMASDGRCKTFDAQADGFVRGEGCGLVLLKRLSDAQKNGDRILAVIRGSAVNQDGHTNGLTAPNALSQAAVIQRALEKARVFPEQISYVETHGTGTALGDPIEVEALTNIIGKPRSNGLTCVLGSVKTNIGHLEGAAGVASVIKTVLALRHDAIPANLHFHQINPHISLDNTPFVIPTELVPWETNGEARIAGISSFGWSGTNAHLILSDPPQSDYDQTLPAASASDQVHLLPVSARSRKALSTLATAYRDFLNNQTSDADLNDVCYSASQRRSHFEHRLMVAGRTRTQLSEQLQAFLQDDAHLGLSSGESHPGQAPGIAFIFPGQGSQWTGMGRQLYEREPIFRQAIQACDQAIRSYTDWSVIEILFAEGKAESLEQIDVIQPALFAVQVALAALWRAWGVEPEAVAGHSMGEVAAAAVAGVISLDDAARIIVLRSQLLKRVSGQGAMALIELSIEQSRKAIAGFEDRLSIAVSNSPTSTVISGDPQAIEQIMAALQQQDIFCRQIKVDVASHSPQMEPLWPELQTSLGDLKPETGTLPIYSTVTGGVIQGQTLDAAYWAKNLRQPVLFAPTVQQLARDGYTIFIEMSPHPILTKAIESTLKHTGLEGAAIPSLLREEDESLAMASALGSLFIHGYNPDWKRIYPHGGRWIELPLYTWEHEPFWLESSSLKLTGIHRSSDFPGFKFSTPEPPGSTAWELAVTKKAFPALYDHGIHGAAVLPASAYLELALEASRQFFATDEFTLTDIEFRKALFLLEEQPVIIQTLLTPGEAGEAIFRIYSRLDDSWSLHARGTVKPRTGGEMPGLSLVESSSQTQTGTDFYKALEALGVQLGPSLQCLGEIRRADRIVTAQILPTTGRKPKLNLDPCLQLSAALSPQGQEHEIFMPVRIERIDVYKLTDHPVLCRTAISGESSLTSMTASAELRNAAGDILAWLQGIHLVPLGSAVTLPETWFYKLNWKPVEHAPGPLQVERSQSGAWLILNDRSGVGQALAALLERNGDRCILAAAGEAFEFDQEKHNYAVRPGSPEDMDHLLAEVFAGEHAYCRGIVHLWALDQPAMDAGNVIAGQAYSSASALHLLQACEKLRWEKPPAIWLVTRGAQAVLEDNPQITAAQATLWGLGRVAAVELPDHWGGLIDLEPGAAAGPAAEFLRDELLNPGGDDQVALYQGQRYAARLARAVGDRSPETSATAAKSPFAVQKSAAYLITGGMGGIGLEIAKGMADHGARRLILMGRTPLPPRAEWHKVDPDSQTGKKIRAIRQIEAAGASVHLAFVDLADAEQLNAFLLAYQDEGWPAIRGVIHAAAVSEDRLIAQMDTDALFRVLRSKMQGAWLLHQAFHDVDFFVMLSSLGALLGQPGQSAYAAANAFLDALAHTRRGLGLPALSINFGGWAETGFAATLGGRRTVDQLVQQGFDSFSIQSGLEAFFQLLQSEQSVAQIAAVPVDWQKVRQSREGKTRGGLLADLLDSAPASAKIPSRETGGIRQELSEAGPENAVKLLEAYVQKQVAQVLKLPAERIEPTRPLGSLGVDSLMAIELRNRLEAGLGIALSATLVWNYPTIAEMVPFLTNKMGISTASGQGETQASQTQPSRTEQDATPDQTITTVEGLSDDEALRQLLGNV